MSVICLDTYRRSKEIIRAKLTEEEMPEPQGYSQEYVVNCLQARYGDAQPKGGVLNLQCVTKKNGTVYIDSYGRGCVHNSKWQYKPKDLSQWNRPMPFPSDIDKIRREISITQRVTLGLKSDPFMWMELKYGTTKEVLRVFCITKTRISAIETMSDLVCHDDYIDLVAECTETVIMNMGCGVETQEMIDSPGAPSLKRRMMAVQKLRDNGIQVKFRVKGQLQDIFKLKEGVACSSSL